MSIVRCPHCELPLIDSEAQQPGCPVCGEPLRPVGAAPDGGRGMPAAATPPSAAHRYGLWAGAIGAVSVAAIFLLGPFRGAEPEPDQAKAGKGPSSPSAGKARRAELKPAPGPKPAEEAGREPAATKEDREIKTVGGEDARIGARKDGESKESDPSETKKEASAKEPMTPVVKKAKAEEPQQPGREAEAPFDLKAAGEEARRDGFKLLVLDDPGREVKVAALNDGARLRIVGKVKTLRLGAVNNKSMLDIAGIEAHEITFQDDVNSSATVRIAGTAQRLELKSINSGSTLDAGKLSVRDVFVRGGVNERCRVILKDVGNRVHFRGAVNGGSVIEIAAPRAAVVFAAAGADPRAGIINGHCQVTIAAHEVSLDGAINGDGTLVLVTMHDGGRLRFGAIQGAARLHWTRADPAGRAPRIQAGHVGAAAEFMERK